MKEIARGTSRMGWLRAELPGFLFLGNGWMYGQKVFREWLDVWSKSKQLVLNKSVSDHCTLVLKTTSVDWGSKPFRILDVWQSDGRFVRFCLE